MQTKITKKKKDLAVEEAAVKRMEEGILERQAKMEEVEKELTTLKEQLKEKEAVLNRMRGGLKNAMKGKEFDRMKTMRVIHRRAAGGGKGRKGVRR